MKTNREVAKIALENPHYFYSGLCSMTKNLKLGKLITEKEEEKFDRFMFRRIRKEHFKLINKNIFNENFSTLYLWRESKWLPRRRWLESVVNKESYKYDYYE